MDSERPRRGAIHRPAYQYLLKQLRAARREAKLTQEEAGQKLGRRKSYVSKCELGERRIDPIDLQEFAILYEKPIAFFLPPEGSRRGTRGTQARRKGESS